MFAIAFDLVVAETAQRHPKGVSQAYADIGGVLAGGRLRAAGMEDSCNRVVMGGSFLLEYTCDARGSVYRTCACDGGTRLRLRPAKVAIG